MGRYILAPDVALRSWEGSPSTYIRRESARPMRLTRDMFDTALLCDGAHDLPGSAALARLLEGGVVRHCGPEESLTNWQRHRAYPCRVTPWLALEITDRCNYNCLHCFNAADESKPQEELTFEQILTILDGAEAAGVQAVLITGGEPLLHRSFRDIVRAIYERDMFIHEINTNGSMLDQDMIDFLRSMGKLPELKISFDGLGFHDWMRGKAGAERDALRAFELCAGEHVPFRVQMNVNKVNLPSLRDSLLCLADLGAPRIRVIRTTMTPRWQKNVPDGCLSWEEYYETALENAAWYAGRHLKPELNFWHFITLKPDSRTYRLDRVRCQPSAFREELPICPTLYGMPAVGANGRIYPCLQYSGTMDFRGVCLGNVVQTGLLPLLMGDKYGSIAHARVRDRLDRGDKCAGCRYHPWCAGGCPALGYLADGKDFLKHDPSACLFFENGWAERVEKALRDWIDLTPVR